MNKEELKEYFKRTEELEKKLTGEDKKTIQWMIYGYNQCAKKYFETLEELERYKNIIDELEKWAIEYSQDLEFRCYMDTMLEKLQELKGE